MRYVLLAFALCASMAHAEVPWPDRLVRIEDMTLETKIVIEVPRNRPSGDVTRPVILRVHVGQDGTVRRVWIDRTSGSNGHDMGALRAMKKQKFQPYRVDGVPTEVTLVVPMNLPKTGLQAS